MDVCSICEENAYLDAGKQCICNDGYFMDSDSNTCLQCSETCATCSSLEKCLTCPEELEHGDTICLSCQSNEYIDGDTCQNCGLSCLQCDAGPNQCLTCSDSSVLQSDGTCVCQDEFYTDEASSECLSCHDSCATCSEAASCTSCKEGYEKADNICLDCADDEYIKGDSCLACGDNCLTCSSGPNQCQTCEANFELKEGNCGCADGTYLDLSSQNSCLPCGSSCATCNSASACESCPEGMSLGATICLECESEDHYIDGDECVQCGADCQSCETGPDQCLTCGANSSLQNGVCVCNDGHFMDLDTETC